RAEARIRSLDRSDALLGDLLCGYVSLGNGARDLRDATVEPSGHGCSLVDETGYCEPVVSRSGRLGERLLVGKARTRFVVSERKPVYVHLRRRGHVVRVELR